MILLNILGIILFFIPGILLDLLIFPKSTWMKRVVFSIALAASINTLLGIALVNLGILKFYNILFASVGLSLLLLSLVLLLQKKIKTEKSPCLFHLLIFSVIGTVWRAVLFAQNKNIGDAYAYAGYLIHKSISATGSLAINIPDIHFYKGMVGGHASYAGDIVTGIIWQNLVSSEFFYLRIFLGTLLFVGFVFLAVKAISKRDDLAVTGALIMALGPIELWRTSSSIWGHSLSYISVLSLFLLFIYKEYKYFILSGLLCFALVFSYYTGAIVIMIACISFILATLIEFFARKKFSLKKCIITSLFFAIILLFSYFFVFGVSNAGNYTIENIHEAASSLTWGGDESANESIANASSQTQQSTMPMPPAHYLGPLKIFGFPVIAIEDFIFLALGLTFIFFFFSKKRDKDDYSIALCLIPVILVSIAFVFVNSPERAFYYFSFFAIAALKVRKKLLPIILIILIITTLTFAELRTYGRPYLTKYDSEIEAAKYIKQNFNGTIFSDQHFSNILILKDYYDVQGISDTDPRIETIYRQNNYSQAEKALKGLRANYIALSKRMRETYILSLNLPQEAMSNEDIYEKYSKKVYDNGDVKVYSVSHENSSIS